MTANINPDTGIAYGYISADALDPDIVHELMYGSQATNVSYESALADYLAEMRSVCVDQAFEFDEDDYIDGFSDRYQSDEETIEGTYEGVSYCTSWLGGALNFFIFESPHAGGCARCSPCVPNAGDLGTRGTYMAYDVPSNWLTEWVK